MSITGHCCLCSQIAGRQEDDLISQMLGETEYVRRVALESDHFAVIPSLGPIVPGHMILCPKQHLKSFSQLVLKSGQVDAVCEDLRCLKTTLVRILESLYDAPVHFFEHGSAVDSSRILCTVDHAHLHLLPACVDVSSVLLADPRWRSVQPNLLSIAGYAERHEYLYYESPSGMAMVATSTGGFKSQYMRRLFASELGIECDWNWRSNPQAESTDQAFRMISAAAQSAHELTADYP